MNSKQTVQRLGTTGTPLVFLHYFGGSAKSWQWVAQELSSDFQCIALNLPGFGGTQPLQKLSIDEFTDWISQTLSWLELSNPVLIGHSMSGKLALNVAAAYPDLVSRVILVAPSPPTKEPLEEEERKRMLNHPVLSEAKITVQQSSNLNLTEEQESLAAETQMLVDHETWKWWLIEGMNQSISDRLSKIAVPVHLLASSDDPVIPLQFLRRDLRKSVQGFEETIIKEVGHLLPLESPRWVAQQVRNIVKVHRQ